MPRLHRFLLKTLENVIIKIFIFLFSGNAKCFDCLCCRYHAQVKRLLNHGLLVTGQFINISFLLIFSFTRVTDPGGRL